MLSSAATIIEGDKSMATDPYDDIIQQFKGLPSDKKEKLIDELSRRVTGNGNDDKRTVGERWRERGFVGIIQDAPKDLSTNPKHMKGFGDDGN